MKEILCIAEAKAQHLNQSRKLQQSARTIDCLTLANPHS